VLDVQVRGAVCDEQLGCQLMIGGVATRQQSDHIALARREALQPIVPRTSHGRQRACG
jgi:hypothetical protein